MPETNDDLWTMTWEDAEETFERADAALLGTGSVEQHSIHMPLSVDSIRAEHLTAELMERADDHDLSLVRLPTLPYGYSEHHMNFPGTITLDSETYKHVIEDVGASLAEHGVDRLVVVNFHGGNLSPLDLAADRLAYDHDLTVHVVNWTDYARDRLEEVFGEGWGHAGDHETSVVEHYRPDLVKQGKKQVQTNRERAETRSFGYFEDLTEEGGLGDPTNSDADVMAEIIDEATDEILSALRADLDAGW